MRERMGHGVAWGNKAGRGESGSWKPVLGLADPAEATSPSADWREWAAKTVPGTVFDQPEPEQLIELTVIVPARNEEDCLGDCLESLVSQSEDIFELGKDWDLIVVDDHSTDRTAEIARGFARVTVIEAGKLEPARTTRYGRRRGGRAGAGCSSPMRIRFTSRAACGTAYTRRSGTRWAC